MPDRRGGRRKNMDQEDHDLLIEIKTKLESLMSQVESSNRSSGERMEALVTGKANNIDLVALQHIVNLKADAHEVDTLRNDQEKRLRELESRINRAIGGVGVVGVLAAIITVMQMLR